MINQFLLNDIVQMKKPHACGTNQWKIIRVGADVKIKCLECGRIVMMERASFIKSCKKIIQSAQSEDQNKEGYLIDQV